MEFTHLFEIPEQRLKAKAGRLLIAEPFMQDPYFKRSVVLLTEHNERGSFGLILNKPIPMYLNEAIESAPRFDSKLALGGPVQKETLHYIHLLGDRIPNSKKIIEGVYWGGDFETVKSLIKTGELSPKNMRLFVGYAGWAEGQLKGEMESNSWIVSKCSKEILFADKPEKLWKRVLEGMGSPYDYLVKLPEDPQLN